MSAGPPTPARRTCGPGLADYNYSIDPSIGTMADFEAFVARCHDHGIASSCSATSAMRATPRRSSSRHRTTIATACRAANATGFISARSPANAGTGANAGAYFFGYWGGNIPSYNFATAAWREETSKYIRFWMDKGLDGFALDAPAVYDGITVDINNACISDVLRQYDGTWMNPEGAARHS